MENMREEFEAWVSAEAKKRGYAFMDQLLRRFVDDSYLTTWVDSAWMGWQAALKAKGQNHG